MSDPEQRELLTAVLKALFGPQLKGKYAVSVSGSFTVDADDKQDAIQKTKDHYKEYFNELNFSAYKIEDLINKE